MNQKTTFIPPVATLCFPSSDFKSIQRTISPYLNELRKEGISPTFGTAVFEAVKNAVDHAHKGDVTKPVLYAHWISTRRTDVIVQDSGNALHPDFDTFIALHKEHPKAIINFYEMTGAKKRGTNLGTGTSFMHLYSDEVHFMPTPEGMMVQLVKYR